MQDKVSNCNDADENKKQKKPTLAVFFIMIPAECHFGLLFVLNEGLFMVTNID